MTSELTTQRLDEIETRAASLTEYALLADEPLQADADQLTGEDVPALIAEIRRLHEPTEPSRYLEDGSTHTVQALTDAGEACVQQACTAARQEARLRQEQYTLRTEVENVLDEVGHMADDQRLTADAAGELRRLLRSALGLDRQLT